jgi:adenylate cyclase
MGVEIERKFLVKSHAWRSDDPGKPIRQGYISLLERRAVRVRVAGSKAVLNIKAVHDDLIHRDEFEYEIPIEDGEALLARHCTGAIIEKVRYRVPLDGHVWEIDEFSGANAGLVVAEIELSAANEPFGKPAWLGEEVSHDPRYLNTYLCTHPYTTW